MKTSLRILHLEDSPRDAELIHAALEAGSLDYEVVHVKSREEFESSIRQGRFDIVLSDYGLPHYDGFAALNYARQKQPHVPFILLSGTLGEEQAVDSLKNGAADYVLKQRLTRLVPAIRRAVTEAEERAKRQNAEERVREQATLLDKAQDAIFVRDLQNRIIYWNKGSERIYGWTPAEALGKNVNELLSNAVPTNNGCSWVMEEGDWIGELRQLTKAGEEVLVESRWTVVRDSAGKPKCILVINTDITEKKKLEAQFLRAQRMESIGALAGGIAHDLNNVLSPILMVADVLQNEFNNKEQRQMLEIVKASAGRGSQMVKQILSFARGVSGEHTVLQVKHLVTDIGTLLRGTFPRSIQIQTLFEKELRLVKGDATQIHQVLMNLCVNARDAMPNGGSLVIEAANLVLENKSTPMQPKPVSGPFIVLKVIDTGHGIPPNLLNKIYEPFFTTKGIDKGTGLGLSTVLGIIKTHHGFLEVSSEVGKGTIFCVYLPASAAPERKLNGSEPIAPPKGHAEPILTGNGECAVR